MIFIFFFILVSNISTMIRYSLPFRILKKKMLFKNLFKIEHVYMCVEGILLTAFNSLRSYYNRHRRRWGSVLQEEKQGALQ